MLYILYVEDPKVRLDTDYPISELYVSNSKKYKFLYLGISKHIDTSLVLNDKKTAYNRFKRNERFYIDYMLAFQLVDQCKDLAIGIYKISDNDDEYSFYINLFWYRQCYGSTIPITDSQYLKIKDVLKLPNTRPVVEIPNIIITILKKEKLDLPFEERQKVYRKRYEDKNRVSINAKSARYYQIHKEELKEKRKKLQGLPELPDNLDVNVV